ncbi:HAD-IA family hydrolase [Lactobacillus sp.]|uniref:HAD-IA family hydrolase n=1 Tax=Lactobacillus sp. TaxID=1591 RepID=UPI003EF3C82B
MKYEAAIFDMDGTILNTSEDLTNALNYAMAQTGHRHDYEVLHTKNFFGSGVVVAIRRALAYEAGTSFEDLVAFGTKNEKVPASVTEDEVNRVLDIFRPYYAAHCNLATGPFPGILSLLKKLRQAGVKVAVVSNKPDEAVQKLVSDLFPGYFDFALGQKDEIRRKPAPDMTLACVDALNVILDKCVYIGDSEIDIQTAANSKMDEIAVTWGFRSVDFLKKRGATVLVDTAEELEKAILGDNMKLVYEESEKRATLYDEDKLVGQCLYEEKGDHWIIVKTVVDPAYGGKGYARQLVDCLVDQARAKGKRVGATCSYAKHVLTKPGYEDVK